MFPGQLAMRAKNYDQLVLVSKKVCRRLRRKSTRAEQLFWNAVRRKRFHGLKFYRQHPLFVPSEGQKSFFVADFYCHQLALVVELDGFIHDDTKEQDDARERIIHGLGITVIRFKNVEIEGDLTAVLKSLENAIIKRTRA